MAIDDGKPRGTGFIPLLFLIAGVGVGLPYLFSPSALESYPLDDAWIHMVYARNLITGHGFAFNPGVQEAGFSSPLWVMILAPLHLLSSGVLLPKLAGLVFLILTALTARRLGGIAAGLLVLFDPALQFAALSGMEVTLFCFLSLFSIERMRAGRPGQAGLAAAAALWARPEGILLAVLLPVFSWFSAPVRKGTVQRTLLLAAPPLIAAGLWVAFCLLVTGRPFPNTFYAKMATPFIFPGLNLPLHFHGFLSVKALYFFFFLWVLFLVPTAFLTARNRARAALPALLFSGLLVIGVWATRPILRVDAFYWERYLIPALPGIHVFLGLGLAGLWSSGRANRAAAAAAGLLLAVGILLNFGAKLDLYEANCRDVARFNVAAGHWIAGNTEPGEQVAVLDAGAIRYFGERHVIDLAGLNDQRFTDVSILAQVVDVTDGLALAAYSKARWFVVFERHYSGRGGFRLVHRIRYGDYSLYVTPEPFSLLILKKAQH